MTTRGSRSNCGDRDQARWCALLLVSMFAIAFATGCRTNNTRGDAAGLAMPTVRSGVPASAPENAAQLEQLVHQAAGVVQARGREALSVFGAADGPWQRADTFLFLLDENGQALRYGAAPEVVGRSVTGLIDTAGRPFGHWQLAAARNREGTTWSFFKAPRRGTFEPVWVASFSQRVRAANDQVWVVGAGVYELPVDDALLARMSAEAADRLQAHPDRMLRRLRSGGGPFVYQSARVVVTNAMGRVLAQPGEAARPGTTQPAHDGALPAPLGQWIRQAGADGETMRWPDDDADARWRAHGRPTNVNGKSYIVVAFAPVS